MEICFMTASNRETDSGALLVRGKSNFHLMLGSAFGVGFLLFMVSAFVENLTPPEVLRIWYWVMSAIALFFMFLQTRGLTEYSLYEKGLLLRNRFWKKRQFYPFSELERAVPIRTGRRTRTRTVYQDSLELYFAGGGSLRFGLGELDNFYEFRNTLLEQIGYFEEQDGEDER